MGAGDVASLAFRTPSERNPNLADGLVIANMLCSLAAATMMTLTFQPRLLMYLRDHTGFTADADSIETIAHEIEYVNSLFVIMVDYLLYSSVENVRSQAPNAVGG